MAKPKEQLDTTTVDSKDAAAQTTEQAPPAQSATPQPQPKRYIASIYPGTGQPLPTELVDSVQKLEKTLSMPVWLLVQPGEGPFGDMDEELRQAFWEARSSMPENSPIAVLVDSPGGYAKNAFQIAKLIRHRCGDFTAVIPRYAKSAATLFVLGASNILFNTDAELGPLDAQIFDPEREEWSSALNDVQSLERLHAFALDAIDQTMMLLVGRTGKKVETVLPPAMGFVAEMMRPMLEDIDVVHYTQRARMLKVAEEYAVRLLRPRYSKDVAEKIARRLVEKYPEHGFVIDDDEEMVLEPSEPRIDTLKPTKDQITILDSMIPFIKGKTFIGQLREENAP